MNPKRGMWVRFIRALRLGEYARREGFGYLAELLDIFYHKEYATFAGKLDHAEKAMNRDEVFRLLSSRPGAFARRLFPTMLRFGADETLEAFKAVIDKVPVRLVLSLGNLALVYFSRGDFRTVIAITNRPKRVASNPLLKKYAQDELKEMARGVCDLLYESLRKKYQAESRVQTGQRVYIDPMLFKIPISVGDRSTNIQDASMALPGARFKVYGDSVRLFMQWGTGLKAQHLDMDLSCRIYLADGSHEDCAYYNLVAIGAKHSGDIRNIPNDVGTAEYIELSLPVLEEACVEKVVFTCNAYSTGNLAVNLMVGWMNSEFPMTISERSGVAYDPSCVQHTVRISEGNLSKGLVFGTLDLSRREILWLEAGLPGSTLHSLSEEALGEIEHRLEAKQKVGDLLALKAEVQGMIVVDDPAEADEVYTYEWALDPSAVTLALL